MAHDAAETFGDSYSPTFAISLRPPSAKGLKPIDQGLVAGIRKMAPPEIKRVLPGRMSQLIYKAFHRKAIGRCVDGAPPHCRYRRGDGYIRKAIMGDGFEIGFGQPVHIAVVVRDRRRSGARFSARSLWLRSPSRLEGKDVPVWVESPLTCIYRAGTEGAGSHIEIGRASCRERV